jgi:hypothetical protein
MVVRSGACLGFGIMLGGALKDSRRRLDGWLGRLQDGVLAKCPSWGGEGVEAVPAGIFTGCLRCRGSATAPRSAPRSRTSWPWSAQNGSHASATASPKSDRQRRYDAAGLTAGQMERTRLELPASLALTRPGSPARMAQPTVVAELAGPGSPAAPRPQAPLRPRSWRLLQPPRSATARQSRPSPSRVPFVGRTSTLALQGPQLRSAGTSHYG